MVLSLLIYDYSRMMMRLSENYKDPFLSSPIRLIYPPTR